MDYSVLQKQGDTINRWNQRTWAHKEGLLTNEETGETVESNKYVFEGIEGIAYFAATMQAMDEGSSYLATMSDPAISDGHVNIFSGDDEHNISMDGTIFVTPSNNNHSYYFNPVYQSSDGGVYAVTGEGLSASNEMYSEGTVFSQTLDATTTITENETEKKNSISIKISISFMYAQEKIVILQMDSDSTVLSRTEYGQGKMPEALTLQTGTAYLIVETHKKDSAGELKISREVYGSDAENIEIFSVREDGVCVKKSIQIGVF